MLVYTGRFGHVCAWRILCVLRVLFMCCFVFLLTVERSSDIRTVLVPSTRTRLELSLKFPSDQSTDERNLGPDGQRRRKLNKETEGNV
jgi:hypothetical protein